MVLVRRCIMTMVTLMSLAACTAVDLSSPAAGGTFSAQVDDLSWPDDPAAMVVKLYSPHTTAGLSGAYDDHYYVPEVQVWRDGEIIWIEREGQKRRVLRGKLTEQEMERLLERIAAAGFFEWEEAYQRLGGNSIPPMHLLVNLADRSKEIREHGGAPDAYYELQAHLLTGAGADGEDFVPVRGYVSVTRQLVALGGATWPDDAEITPEKIGDGRYVDGEVLAFAWELVNRNPTGPAYVEHEGESYTIMVRIPGVSHAEPPDGAE